MVRVNSLTGTLWETEYAGQKHYSSRIWMKGAWNMRNNVDWKFTNYEFGTLHLRKSTMTTNQQPRAQLHGKGD